MRLYLAESVDPLSCHRFRLLIDNFWFAQGSLREALLSVASYLRQCAVESRQSIQRTVRVFATELQQIHSLLVSLFFIPVRVNRLVNAVNGLVGESAARASPSRMLTVA